MAPVISTALSGFERFFRQPSGCAEQNMAATAPIVYALYYLRNSGRLTDKWEKELPDFIRTGK